MDIMDEYMMSYYERAHLMPGAEAVLESCARKQCEDEHGLFQQAAVSMGRC